MTGVQTCALPICFPVTIKWFDKDSVNSEKSLKKILDEFNQNKIDILVGTQMLSKGHDYHNVKLAVVLGMDTNLF